MANQEHLERIKQGLNVWNQWRQENPGEIPDFEEVDLHEADLSGAHLEKANFRGANLERADLSGANLSGAHLEKASLVGADLRETNLLVAYLGWADLTVSNLSWADLRQADLRKATLKGAILGEANLEEADLREVDLREANLEKVNLGWANLCEANLEGANLERTNMVYTLLARANLSGCRIHGISGWDVSTDETTNQTNLIITSPEEPTISVDNLKVAQFLYLFLNNKEIQDVIGTITSRVALILGHFTPDRKEILETIRDALRKKKYSPVLFDVEKPAGRSFIETASTLAHLARFVIADITDSEVVLQEVSHIVRTMAVPVKPLLLTETGNEPGMLTDLRENSPTLLETYEYTDAQELLKSLEEQIIVSVESKGKELEGGETPSLSS